jgi:hypothetical protein
MIFKFGEDMRNLFRNLKWVDRLVSSLEKKDFNKIAMLTRSRMLVRKTPRRLGGRNMAG